ncbi:hypothetical protein MZM54_00335 [[Brevibacterium] frigoritolerans]|nr:hypothetical protein [Peribacillus frigoritolerans]
MNSVMVKNNFDFENFNQNPGFFWRGNLSNSKNGVTNLEFNPTICYPDGEEKESFSIDAYHINFVDWICMLTTLNKVPEGRDEGYWDVSDYLKEEDLDDISIPIANAGPYISSREDTTGNCYTTSNDTYGAEMGNTASKLYFLYIADINKYVVVTYEYLDN